jgi:protoporphyrinogen/coproporphyrinogen III oxidase
MTNTGRSCIVIGAGISGLCTAYWLHNEGFNVTVVERDDVPGGAMKTIRRNEYLIDTGPNSALETTPLFSELFEELGISDQRVYANEASNTRYILRNGTLHPLPMSPGLFLKSKLWSTGGKLRLLKEPFIGRADKEESVADFVERRLGSEFLDYAINPFVAGVYAGSPEELSVRSAFPKLYRLEEKYGGLIKGMIKGRKERKQRAEQSKQSARMFSFLEGMATFPCAIADVLGDRILRGARVETIERSDNGYTVSFTTGSGSRQMSTPYLVLSVPAYHASTLLEPLDTTFAQLLADIYYPPVALVYLGYASGDIRRTLDGFGYLIPAKEKREILGTIWTSTIFPNRVPAGKEAFTTFVGGSRQPDVLNRTDEELLDMVIGEVNDIVHIDGAPEFRYLKRWERAIPQYKMGYAKVLEAIADFEKRNPGFYLCANYRGGIAVGDCVMSARRTVDTIIGRIPGRQMNLQR